MKSFACKFIRAGFCQLQVYFAQGIKLNIINNVIANCLAFDAEQPAQPGTMHCWCTKQRQDEKKFELECCFDTDTSDKISYFHLVCPVDHNCFAFPHPLVFQGRGALLGAVRTGPLAGQAVQPGRPSIRRSGGRVPDHSTESVGSGVGRFSSAGQPLCEVGGRRW